MIPPFLCLTLIPSSVQFLLYFMRTTAEHILMAAELLLLVMYRCISLHVSTLWKSCIYSFPLSDIPILFLGTSVFREDHVIHTSYCIISAGMCGFVIIISPILPGTASFNLKYCLHRNLFRQPLKAKTVSWFTLRTFEDERTQSDGSGTPGWIAFTHRTHCPHRSGIK